MLRLLPMLLSAASSDLDTVIRRKRRNFIGYCVSFIFGLTAYFAGVMAFVTWLMRSNDPLMSWVVVGVVAISFALLIIAVLSGLTYYEKTKKKDFSNTTSAAAMVAAAQVGKSKRMAPILLALVGAYFAWSQVGKSKTQD